MKMFEASTIIGAIVILSYLTAIYSVALYEVDAIPEDQSDAFVVKVTGSQWTWRFEYPNGERASELVINAGEQIIVEVESRDVIHSLYFPELGWKIDAVPNSVNRFAFKVFDPGEYNILCAEFCGLAHADMRTTLTVLG
ncbi:MAG: cytochrome c oxidase subunit II [Candidatus Bathyarchaeia archaeon]